MKEGKFRQDTKKKIFTMVMVRHMNRLLREMVENIQVKFGCGSKQPDLAEDVPVHCRGVGLADLE